MSKPSPAALHPMPFTRVELVVIAVQDQQLQVLLALRQAPPHAGRWAFSGGVVRIDLDATLDEAVKRIAQEGAVNAASIAFSGRH